jgi:hypothetical protein
MSTMKERLIIPALIAFVLYTLIYPKGSYAQELPTVRRHIIWNNQQLDLKEDLAHLV